MIRVRVKGLDQLKKDLRKLAAQKVEQIVADEFEATAADIDARATARIPVDQGFLKNQQGFEAKGLLAVNFNNASYAPFIEWGTKTKVQIPPEMQEEANKFRGQKGGNYQEFKENIAAWMKRKGIPEQALYPIMAKIMKIGIEPHPFMYISFKEGIKGLEKRIDKAIQAELNRL